MKRNNRQSQIYASAHICYLQIIIINNVCFVEDKKSSAWSQTMFTSLFIPADGLCFLLYAAKRIFSLGIEYKRADSLSCVYYVIP